MVRFHHALAVVFLFQNVALADLTDLPNPIEEYNPPPVTVQRPPVEAVTEAIARYSGTGTISGITRKSQGQIYRLEVQPETSLTRLAIKAIKSKLMTHESYLITTEGRRIKIEEFSKSILIENSQTALSESLNSRERISAIEIRAEAMQAEADVQVTAYSDESRTVLKSISPIAAPPERPRPDRGGDAVICRWNGTNTQPYNRSQNQFIGRTGYGFNYAEDCEGHLLRVQKVSRSLVCNWNGRAYSPYKISDGAMLGRDGFGFSQVTTCEDAIAKSVNGLICNWNGAGFSPYLLDNPSTNVGRPHFGFKEYESCNDNIAAAAGGVLCQWNGNNYQPYKISTNEGLGLPGYGYNQLSACQGSISTAPRGFVCNWTGGGYAKYSVRTNGLIDGVYRELESCRK